MRLHAESKWCARCQQHKPLSEFNKLKKSPDGRQYRCRSCNKETSAESNQSRSQRFEIARDLVAAAFAELCTLAETDARRLSPGTERSLHDIRKRLGEAVEHLHGLSL